MCFSLQLFPINILLLEGCLLLNHYGFIHIGSLNRQVPIDVLFSGRWSPSTSFRSTSWTSILSLSNQGRKVETCPERATFRRGSPTDPKGPNKHLLYEGVNGRGGF